MPFMAGFVTQVLAQSGKSRLQTAANATASYEAAERVDALELRWLSATI